MVLTSSESSQLLHGRADQVWNLSKNEYGLSRCVSSLSVELQLIMDNNLGLNIVPTTCHSFSFRQS